MKQILAIILLFFFISGFSQSPSEKEVKTVAVNFYNYLQETNISVNDIKIKKDHFFNEVLTYSTIVFNNNDWLIISGDKQADPILAYSKEKNYSDFIPPSVRDWLLQYDYYVYNIKKGLKEEDDSVDYTILWNNLLENDLMKYTKSNDGVDPLLTTKWGQSTSNTGNDPYAYNYYAPPGKDEFGNDCNQTHALAGCPAVALGQILRYWQYPNCSVFNWSDMPNTLDVSNPNYDTQKKEIANLLRNIADKMQDYMDTSFNYFSCTASGTNSVEAILYPTRDNFYCSGATLIKKSDYSDNEWKDELCYELDHNRPILYTGFNDRGGHAYVCDGWEKVLVGKKFHFNFGWLGYYDDFYRFTDYFPYNQQAIINIYPTMSCNYNLTIFQSDKYDQPSIFYNPKAGNIYSSPEPIVIADNDIVHYEAYNEIVLENFETEDGAEFTAEIVPCPINCDIYTNYKNSKSLQLFTDADINTNKNINIYPNPVNNILFIESNFDNPNNNIQIYNSLGILIINKQITQNITTIDISQLSNGVYFVKILSDNFIFQQKIIKQ